MNFVNIHGQPILLDPKAKARGGPSRPRADAYHKGWRAVGYSPQQIEEGRVKHAKDREAAAMAGNHLPEWSEDWFFRHHKPAKIRHKPYEVREAAVTACELAQKVGWKNCYVVPVSKGDPAA